MQKLTVLALLVAGSIATASAAPAEYHLEKTHVDLLFAVSHLGFTQKHGSFRDLDASLTCDPDAIEKCHVEVVIQANSIDTGFDARDKDVKGERFLDAAKYPEIRFVSRKVTKVGTTGLHIEGELTMHGVTKPLALDATLNKSAPNSFDKRPTLGFSAHGVLKRSEFGVAGLLPMIGDEVTITIDAEFNHAI